MNPETPVFDPASRIDEKRLWSHLAAFSNSVRTSGSPAELKAFSYARDFLESHGYSTRLLQHPAFISVPESARLFLARREIDCIPNAMGKPTDGTEGVLVEADADSELQGKIALCFGLAAPASVKAISERGAIGAVFINGDQRYEMVLSPVWGSPAEHDLEKLPAIPVVSVLGSEADRLRQAARDGQIVRLETRLDTGWRDIPLLEATLEPTNGDGSLILFSGHIDAWHLGAMDNGGANATMLEVATILAELRQDLRRSVRFLFWSGHSHGRYAGSQWYADNHYEELRERALIHINIDSVGARGATVLSEAPSMKELGELASLVIATEVDQEYSGNRMERAGDQSFFGHGVSSIFMGLSEQPKYEGDVTAEGFASLFGGGRTGGFGWWWHTPEDTIDKLDPGNLARDARVYTRLAYSCCTRTVPPLMYSRTVQEIRNQLVRYHAAAAEHLDLSLAIQRCELLFTALTSLEARLESNPDGQDWRILKSLARVLVPLNYVAGPVHQHDPALAQPAVPKLAGALKLATETDAAMLKHRIVGLIRERNHVESALRDALEIAEAATLHKHMEAHASAQPV